MWDQLNEQTVIQHNYIVSEPHYMLRITDPSSGVYRREMCGNMRLFL